MFLPDQEDPDTLIQKIGKNNFLKKISQAHNLSFFLFECLSKKVNLQTLEGRVKLIKQALPIINLIPGQILKLCLRQELGNKIGILDENKLNQLLTLKKKSNTYQKNKSYIVHNIEHILIGLLIQNPKLVKFVPTLKGLQNCKYKKIIIFINLVKLCRFYPTATTKQLVKLYITNKYQNRYVIDLIRLAHWKHMIKKEMIIITFIDTLNKLYNSILEQRQDELIAQARLSPLTTRERQELWLLNQKLHQK